MSKTGETVDEEKEYYSLTKKVFDILAPFYDIIAGPFSRLRGKVVDFTVAKKGSKILDVATGTGKQAFAFAKQGFDVVGVDLSEGMVKVANRKNRYKNARFQVADATTLPFENNSFDIVSISFALHTMPPTVRRAVLREMARVTRIGGTVIIVDFALPLNKLGKYLVYDLVRVPMGKHFVEFTHSDLEGLLGESGFKTGEQRWAIFGGVRILRGTRESSTKLEILAG